MPHVRGIALAEAFHADQVQPAWRRAVGDLPYAAALTGRGSEVLGYDDDMSVDHDWSARVMIFVEETAGDPDDLQRRLREQLPERFEELPTDVRVITLRGWLQRELSLDATGTWDAADWLSLSEQRLCATTAGAVFHDQIGLAALRDRLRYYPRDVWLYLLSCGWWRVHPELNLVGRTGHVGDGLGSRLIAADLVDGLMRLGFLIERRYAPYRKWFGTAFSELRIAAELGPILAAVLAADDAGARQRRLARAYEVVAAAFGALELVPALTLEPLQLWDRPFVVPWADFPGALAGAITDPQVRRVAERWPTGFVDGVRELLWAPRERIAVRDLIRGAG